MLFSKLREPLGKASRSIFYFRKWQLLCLCRNFACLFETELNLKLELDSVWDDFGATEWGDYGMNIDGVSLGSANPPASPHGRQGVYQPPNQPRGAGRCLLAHQQAPKAGRGFSSPPASPRRLAKGLPVP